LSNCADGETGERNQQLPLPLADVSGSGLQKSAGADVIGRLSAAADAPERRLPIGPPLGQVLADHGVQHGDPVQPVRQSSACQHLAVIVDDLHGVRSSAQSSPTNNTAPPKKSPAPDGSAEETADDLIAECSPHKAGHVIPAVVLASPRPSGRTVCRKTSTADPRRADPPATIDTEPAETAEQSH
jgi:hypothetical protein